MRHLLLALTLAVSACAGAEAMSLASSTGAAEKGNELGLHPGETMAFEVQLGGVLVGEAQLAVGDIGMIEGKRALVVRSRAATAGAAALVKKISDEAMTVIEADTGRPMSVETMVQTGPKTATAKATFTGNVADITYTTYASKEPRKMKVDFGTKPLHDAHTAMAQLRGWKATPGTTRTVYVVGGRRLWRVDVKYVGEETIGSALGNRRAVVFDGTGFRARPNLTAEPGKAARTFRVWLSDDADRVPLKVVAKTELGDVVMELVDYNRP